MKNFKRAVISGLAYGLCVVTNSAIIVGGSEENQSQVSAVETTTTSVVNDLTAKNGQNQSQISATSLVNVLTAFNPPLCRVSGSGALQANYETENFSICIYYYNEELFYLGIDKRNSSWIELPAGYDNAIEGYFAVNGNIKYSVNESRLCIQGVAKQPICSKVLFFKDYLKIH